MNTVEIDFLHCWRRWKFHNWSGYEHQGDGIYAKYCRGCGLIRFRKLHDWWLLAMQVAILIAIFATTFIQAYINERQTERMNDLQRQLDTLENSDGRSRTL